MSKQKIRILSDATLDLPPEWVQELNIGILPTQIMIEDREKPYRQYIDITSEEFFGKLVKCKELPTTAVPKQGDVFKVYEASLKDFESLIVFGHSSKISSSYALARKVAEQMFPEEDITVIDSQTITVIEGLVVYEAGKLAQAGATKEEIIARTNELIPYTHGVGILQSLDYLRKGGRISIAQHLLGSLIGFKPIVTVEDGLVQNIGKVRGFEKGLELFKENIPNILKNRKTELVAVMHAIMPDKAKELQEFILSQKENVPERCEVMWIGPVLGAHMGPNVLGIGWIGDWDRKWFTGK